MHLEARNVGILYAKKIQRSVQVTEQNLADIFLRHVENDQRSDLYAYTQFLTLLLADYTSCFFLFLGAFVKSVH